eukprot:12032024-Alexandrium_andersonii.AAC.1
MRPRGGSPRVLWRHLEPRCLASSGPRRGRAAVTGRPPLVCALDGARAVHRSLRCLRARSSPLRGRAAMTGWHWPAG